MMPHDDLTFAKLQGFYEYITVGPDLGRTHPDYPQWSEAYDQGRNEAEALTLDDQDHTLTKGARCWITAGKASILINAEGEGVVVDVFPVGEEDEGSVGSTWVLDNELEGEPS